MRTTLKNSSKIGHEDFDFKYQMNKKRNESKLVTELKELREARKELRDFEQNIDKDLPSAKKLKEFRAVARDLIDSSDSNETSKIQSQVGRTNREEADINEKIRALQKENP